MCKGTYESKVKALGLLRWTKINSNMAVGVAVWNSATLEGPGGYG